MKWILKHIIGAIALFAVLAISAGLILKLVTNHGKEITVPDLTNMSVSEAVYTAGLQNLRVDVTDSVYIRRMGRGMVYSQNPKAGSSVKKGRRILLTINSVNPKKVQMPNLVGYSMRQAKAELNSRGLMLRSELLSRGLGLGKLMYVSDMATNNVLRQMYRGREIEPGTMIESGSDINLIVGLNPDDNQTYIPDVVGMKYMRAVDAIHDNSLNIKALRFDKTVKSYADSLDATVYRQGPSASSEPILIGSEITLYLSTDPLKK